MEKYRYSQWADSKIKEKPQMGGGRIQKCTYVHTYGTHMHLGCVFGMHAYLLETYISTYARAYIHA